MLNESSPQDQPPELPPPPAPDTPEQIPHPVHPDVLLRAAIGLGAVMVALAIGWVNWLGDGDIWEWLRPADAWQLVPGIISGMIFAWTIWRLGQHMAATRRIVILLEQTLDLNAMTFRHALLFSILAAIPEEMLFRGALQQAVGLLTAALIFGALHALTRAYFLYAACAGLFLGALLVIGGTLWLPIGAHFAVDLVMFMLLLQR
jgi:membrane protease YdiL (CAAX protease family)